jgi:type IV secretory pathway TrbL component
MVREKEVIKIARDTHRVMPHQDGGWQVKRDGDSKASHHTDTQAQAIEFGREISRNQNTELQIHRANGQIRSSDSHGNDPYPPKG